VYHTIRDAKNIKHYEDSASLRIEVLLLHQPATKKQLPSSECPPNFFVAIRKENMPGCLFSFQIATTKKDFG
jgi:hypothetical protein